jgi:hypothetical protein
MMVFVMFAMYSPQARAQEHIVSLRELQARLGNKAKDRASNIADIQRVLSYPSASAALKKSNVNPDQMRAAVATLDDEELARLADRARASEKDVEAGFIVGILALIGLIVVIIVVLAVVN